MHPNCRCKLTTPVLSALRANVDEVSFNACQCVFERAYLYYRANPKYLFVSTQGKAKLLQEVIATSYRMAKEWDANRATLGLPEKDLDGYPIPHDTYAIANLTTGSIVPVVALPDLDDNQVILGFLES